jgi:hypothetical protein
LKILAVLWAYMTIGKILTAHNPIRLTYGQEVVMMMDFIVQILCIDVMEKLTNSSIVELI